MASGDASGLERCIGWYGGDTGVAVDPDQHCLTRDVFEGRLTRVLALCEKRGYDANESALLTAVVGEIGNNSFDHNLGHWIDTPGCWFGYSMGADSLVWLADRGRGVLASLSAVLPELSDHQTALETAFEKVVSGRHPERRGNGLKFVRSVVNANPNRGLVALSGSGCLELGGLGGPLWESRPWPVEQDRGTLMVVRWRFE